MLLCLGRDQPSWVSWGALPCPSQWREPTLSPAALLACPLVDVPCLSPTGLGCPSVPQGTPR